MDTEPLTLPFETFWSWLVTHPNCVLRAGTPETVLYDDEDLHWHFAVEALPEAEDSPWLLVQLIRGKRLMGELFLAPDHIGYVQASAGDQDGEYVFELVQEAEAEPVVAYYFVLAHGYDGAEAEARGHMGGHSGSAGPHRIH